MSFYLVIQSGFFSDLLLFGLGFSCISILIFFSFFLNVNFSQINSPVSMGSLSCLGSIMEQQSMAAIK